MAAAADGKTVVDEAVDSVEVIEVETEKVAEEDIEVGVIEKEVDIEEEATEMEKEADTEVEEVTEAATETATEEEAALTIASAGAEDSD